MALSDRRLPEGATQYRRTPDFTATTTPKGLLADHSTKQGTWGLLVVETGRVAFHDRDLGETRQVEAGETQVILPTTIHHITPSADARFHVAFWRLGDMPT